MKGKALGFVLQEAAMNPSQLETFDIGDPQQLLENEFGLESAGAASKGFIKVDGTSETGSYSSK